jgi:Domain of unknown function (DUF362)
MPVRFAPDATFPRQLVVEADVPSNRLADPAGALAAQLTALLADEADALFGKRIAIGAGSRGIDRIPEVIRTVVTVLKAKGALPFILPVMGNHGGATAEGQAGILDGLGITEATVGAPIRPRMDTRLVASTPAGTPVYVSEEAMAADGVILVNRIKPHTDFESTRLGSGILKMAAIGLGRSEGAAACHRAAGRLGFEAVLPAVAQVVFAHVKMVAAVGIVEDGLHHLARVEAIAPAAIADREAALLGEARALMPALPFPRIDVLVIDAMGKDISGAGMDTNIIGRGVDGRPFATRRSDVGAIWVRSLTPASHGNAIGIGLADVASKSLVDSIDPDSIFVNALSSMTPNTAKTPMYFPTDRECLKAAVRFSGSDAGDAGIVRIKSTLALDRFVVSETYRAEIASRSDLRIVSEPEALTFDGAGNFETTADPLGAPAAH